MTFASLNRSHNAWMVGDGARVKRNEEPPRVMHMTRHHSGPSIIHYSGAACSVLFPVGHDEIPAIVAYSRHPYEAPDSRIGRYFAESSQLFSSGSHLAGFFANS